MRRVRLSLTAALVLLALPAGSAVAAPGSAIDEYQEHVPGAGGDRPSDEAGPGSGSSSGPSSLPPAVVAALEEQGPSGVAAANLAEATAPDRGGKDSGGGAASAATTDSAGSGSGDGPLDGILDVIAGDTGGAGDDGMGLVLPLILGLSALAAILFLIGRKRGQSMTRDA